MKKILTIVLVLIGQHIYCQEYFFDKFIEYEEVGRTRIVFMFNSKDSSYMFFSKSYDDNLVGTVIDSKRNINHHYRLDSTKKSIDFIYINSEPPKIKNQDCPDENNFYDIKQNKKDSITSFEITRYKNDKKRVIIASASIRAIESKEKIFSKMINYFLYHFVYCQKLNVPNNYLPTSVEINYKNGTTVSTQLMQNKDINTSLSIKKEDIQYKK